MVGRPEGQENLAQVSPWVEWHEDKDCLGWFFVPNRQEDPAQD
jgi:hypothetical protein